MIYTEEQWRPIEGFEGVYEVSSQGRVKSCSRRIWNGHSFFESKPKILKPKIITRGYCQVKLHDGKGKKEMFFVHRLVAQAFIPNDNPSFTQINHINGIKTDNRVENLEWCDNSYNQIHAYRFGLRTPSPMAGRPKKAVKLIKDGEVLRFSSISAACSFLGGPNKMTQLRRVLYKQKRYKTIMGYVAEFDK